MLGPILRGERVTLALPNPDHWSQTRFWFADVETMRYTLSRWLTDEAGHQRWLNELAESSNDVFWALEAGGEMVGITSIKDVDLANRHASSNTLIGSPARWGQGYASETVRLRTTYAFAELGLQRLETESFVENIGMHRALERSGYHIIGRKRRCVYRHGSWHDMFVFELLQDEWDGV